MPAAASSAVLHCLDRHALLAVERALILEWIETDGVGGYASSTVLFCPTRRYHGLLVGAPAGSTRRHVFLSRFEETLIHDGEAYPLSCARYGSCFSPAGFDSITGFELRPWPATFHQAGEARVSREVLLVRGSAVALCRYRVTDAPAPFRLLLRPLLAFREADHLTHENDALDPRVEPIPGGIRTRPYDVLPALHLTVGGADHTYQAEPTWYRGLRYGADEERGFWGQEDQSSPGVLHVEGRGNTEVVIAATIGEPVDDPLALWRAESTRRRDEAAAALEVHPLPAARVTLGARDFLYRDPAGRRGIDAGWPWFGEWGRDTFIALPGLTLALGDLAACGEVLFGACSWLRDGLLPNVFGPDRDHSHYGSVDASLWFARAVQLFERAGAPREQVLDELRPALEEIGRSYRDGTGLGIQADEGGLIAAGGPHLNATWMDAQTANGPVTPRHGCAVEINALWYSLLQHAETLAGHAGDRRARTEWQTLRRRVRRTFLERFWLDDGRYLADRWEEGAPDRRVRPNMVIAASLELSPLTRAQRLGVVEKAEAELLTPRGLRTLSPRDPAYVPAYGGGPEERDAAYHQGTVWPWLLGFHVEACLRARGTQRPQRAALAALWDACAPELDRAGLNHLSEVFDGDPPHRPGGTIAQAWNTAEWLRSRALLARSRRP